jgi:REP-associated tyrosine transposase
MAGTYTNLLYQVVFSTKGRRRLITPVIEDELHKYIGGIVRNLEGDLLEANGDMDHRHLLMVLKPKFALSDVCAILRPIRPRGSING